MKPVLQKTCRALTFLVLCSSPAAAQLINIRTAPVNVSEQFFTFPSRYLGMGGGIALKDLEADPFANPATAARINGARVMSTPTLYSIPDHPGFGRTMSATVMGGSTAETPFGAVSLAAQEVESAQSNFNTGVPGIPRTSRFANNYFAFGLLGQKIPKQNAAIAVSVSYANIDHLHMVDLLYPEAAAIQQGGSISDIRLGYLRELKDDGSFEAVIVRNHVAMQHTVTYVDYRLLNNQWRPSLRQEYNADETTTWGAHAAYRWSVPQSSWDLGGFLTANTKTHPKIPNYNFSHIPRDPGNSRAYALGVGALNSDTASLLAFDFTYMPMWTSTWAEAATPTTTRTGAVLPIGAPTIENEFVFSNYDFHAGWAHKWSQTWVQLGLDVLHVEYALDQYNNVTEFPRKMDDSWNETTLSWGLAFELTNFQVRYFGRARGGLDLGGEQSAPIVNIPPMAGGGGPDIVSAPGGIGALGMQPNSVIMHQFSISIPIGHH